MWVNYSIAVLIELIGNGRNYLNAVKGADCLRNGRRKSFAASCSNRQFYSPPLTNTLSQISPLHIILLHSSTDCYYFIFLSECFFQIVYFLRKFSTQI